MNEESEEFDLVKEIHDIVRRNREDAKKPHHQLCLQLTVSRRSFDQAEKDGMIYHKDGKTFWDTNIGPVEITRGL